MNNFTLSSVLLFCLVIPFIMAYRLSWGETPYWYFGIIFALLLGNIGLDISGWKKKKVEKLKSIIVWLTVALVIGGAVSAAIIVRHRVAPGYQIHDIILQQEAALRFLLQGKNPWATTYFNTHLADWHYSDTEINPALFHFVMMPWYLVFFLPFYFVSVNIFGFFDGRMPLAALFAFTLVLAWRLLKKETEKRRLFLILLAFNPATLGYFLEGRSDFFMFAFLFWAWYLLEKRRYFLSGIPMALAFATKQSVWPIFPFYLAYLWFRRGPPKTKAFGRAGRGAVRMMKLLLPFVVTFAVIVLPFFLWDARAFLESTVLFFSGQVPHSYPVAGYGWGMVLHQLGVIKDVHDYYPFWLWQAAVGIPLFWILFRWLTKKPTVSRLIICYGIFTFVFWYFSRYFNNSHLGYLSMVFITAYFWPRKD